LLKGDNVAELRIHDRDKPYYKSLKTDPDDKQVIVKLPDSSGRLGMATELDVTQVIVDKDNIATYMIKKPDISKYPYSQNTFEAYLPFNLDKYVTSPVFLGEHTSTVVQIAIDSGFKKIVNRDVLDPSIKRYQIPNIPGLEGNIWVRYRFLSNDTTSEWSDAYTLNYNRGTLAPIEIDMKYTPGEDLVITTSPLTSLGSLHPNHTETQWDIYYKDGQSERLIISKREQIDKTRYVIPADSIMPNGEYKVRVQYFTDIVGVESNVGEDFIFIPDIDLPKPTLAVTSGTSKLLDMTSNYAYSDSIQDAGKVKFKFRSYGSVCTKEQSNNRYISTIEGTTRSTIPEMVDYISTSHKVRLNNGAEVWSPWSDEYKLGLGKEFLDTGKFISNWISENGTDVSGNGKFVSLTSKIWSRTKNSFNSFAFDMTRDELEHAIQSTVTPYVGSTTNERQLPIVHNTMAAIYNDQIDFTVPADKSADSIIGLTIDEFNFKPSNGNFTAVSDITKVRMELYVKDRKGKYHLLGAANVEVPTEADSHYIKLEKLLGEDIANYGSLSTYVVDKLPNVYFEYNRYDSQTINPNDKPQNLTLEDDKYVDIYKIPVYVKIYANAGGIVTEVNDSIDLITIITGIPKKNAYTYERPKVNGNNEVIAAYMNDENWLTITGLPNWIIATLVKNVDHGLNGKYKVTRIQQPILPGGDEQDLGTEEVSFVDTVDPNWNPATYKVTNNHGIRQPEPKPHATFSVNTTFTKKGMPKIPGASYGAPYYGNQRKNEVYFGGHEIVPGIKTNLTLTLNFPNGEKTFTLSVDERGERLDLEVANSIGSVKDAPQGSVTTWITRNGTRGRLAREEGIGTVKFVPEVTNIKMYHLLPEDTLLNAKLKLTSGETKIGEGTTSVKVKDLMEGTASIPGVTMSAESVFQHKEVMYEWTFALSGYAEVTKTVSGHFDTDRNLNGIDGSSVISIPEKDLLVFNNEHGPFDRIKGDPKYRLTIVAIADVKSDPEREYYGTTELALPGDEPVNDRIMGIMLEALYGREDKLGNLNELYGDVSNTIRDPLFNLSLLVGRDIRATASEKEDIINVHFVDAKYPTESRKRWYEDGCKLPTQLTEFNNKWYPALGAIHDTKLVNFVFPKTIDTGTILEELKAKRVLPCIEVNGKYIAFRNVKIEYRADIYYKKSGYVNKFGLMDHDKPIPRSLGFEVDALYSTRNFVYGRGGTFTYTDQVGNIIGRRNGSDNITPEENVDRLFQKGYAPKLNMPPFRDGTQPVYRYLHISHPIWHTPEYTTSEYRLRQEFIDNSPFTLDTFNATALFNGSPLTDDVYRGRLFNYKGFNVQECGANFINLKYLLGLVVSSSRTPVGKDSILSRIEYEKDKDGTLYTKREYGITKCYNVGFGATRAENDTYTAFYTAIPYLLESQPIRVEDPSSTTFHPADGMGKDMATIMTSIDLWNCIPRRTSSFLNHRYLSIDYISKVSPAEIYPDGLTNDPILKDILPSGRNDRLRSNIGSPGEVDAVIHTPVNPMWDNIRRIQYDQGKARYKPNGLILKVTDKDGALNKHRHGGNDYYIDKRLFPNFIGEDNTYTTITDIAGLLDSVPIRSLQRGITEIPHANYNLVTSTTYLGYTDVYNFVKYKEIMEYIGITNPSVKVAPGDGSSVMIPGRTFDCYHWHIYYNRGRIVFIPSAQPWGDTFSEEVDLRYRSMLYKEVIISHNKFLIAELDELLLQETLIPTLPIIPDSTYDSDLTRVYANGGPTDESEKWRHVINGVHLWIGGNARPSITYKSNIVPAGMNVNISNGEITGKCGGYMHKGKMLTSLNMYGQYGDVRNKTIGRCSQLLHTTEGVSKISTYELKNNPNTVYMYRPVLIYLGTTNEPGNLHAGGFI